MRPLEDGMGVEKIEAVLFEVQITFSFIPTQGSFWIMYTFCIHCQVFSSAAWLVR
jgi:hypothetical protein